MDKTAIKIVSYFNGIEEFLIGLLFFTLPFGWTLSIVPLVLFTTTLLINIATKPKRPSKDKIYYFLPLLLLFTWEAISLAYSTNTKDGVETLTTQLVMFVLTLAFLFNRIRPSSIKKGFYLFLLGCLTAVLIQLGIAFYHSSSIIGDAYIFRPFYEASKLPLMDSDVMGNYFLGTDISRFVHPAYAAFMLAIAMFIIFQNTSLESEDLNYKRFWVICFLLFGTFIIAYSLVGTIVLISVIILAVAGVLSTQYFKYGDIARTIYSMLLIFLFIALINPQVRIIVDKDIPSTALELRTNISQSSLNAISNNWFWGVGIGDAQGVLNDQYMSDGLRDIAKRHLNSHNQFLTTWLQSGIIGLIILCWSFGTMIHRARKKKVNLLYFFAITSFVSFLFESMLLRYWGVVIFTLFYGMLYFYSTNELKGKVSIQD